MLDRRLDIASGGATRKPSALIADWRHPARSLQLDLRDYIDGYGNRQMVQRNERLWFHPA